MACINNANPYNVSILAGACTWFDKQGAQSGKKTMIIRNTGSKDCQISANNPNLTYGQGFLFSAGDALILKNVHATTMKWYACMNGTDTTTFSILELTG